jgi:hypothetical protein
MMRQRRTTSLIERRLSREEESARKAQKSSNTMYLDIANDKDVQPSSA